MAAVILLAATYRSPTGCPPCSSRMMMILRSSVYTRVLLASGFGSFTALPRRSAILNPSSFLPTSGGLFFKVSAYDARGIWTACLGEAMGFPASL